MIIYKTTNLINGKLYIGQDSKNNPNYLGSGLILNKAIKKYGKENFKKEIIELCSDKDELNNKEIYWIAKLNTTDKNIGYNITKGGGGLLGYKILGRVFTMEHKLNIKLNHHDVSGENNPMFGKTHSDEVKKASRLRMLGTKASTITKTKMSKKRIGEGNANVKLTEKQVLCVREFYFTNNLTLTELAKMFNVKKACIYKIVNYMTWKHI